MATVYAKNSCGVGRAKGGITHLSKGDPYDDKHPLVKARPELFTSEPPEAAGREPAIERATRAPGEKRTAPKKSQS